MQDGRMEVPHDRQERKGTSARAFLPVRWSRLTLRPHDWGPPSSSVQGTLEQAAISLRRDHPHPGIPRASLESAGRFFTS